VLQWGPSSTGCYCKCKWYLLPCPCNAVEAFAGVFVVMRAASGSRAPGAAASRHLLRCHCVQLCINVLDVLCLLLYLTCCVFSVAFSMSEVLRLLQLRVMYFCVGAALLW